LLEPYCKLAGMKAIKSLVVAVVVLVSFSSQTQLTKETRTFLKRSEDSLKVYANKMIFDREASARFMADSIFIRSLVRTLKTPYSFYYPFDSLKTVSRVYAQDSSFRIITWQFMRDETYYRQRGAIQMRTADGSLKLFPLIDMSDFTDNPVDSVRANTNWIGAIYYGMVMKTFNNKKYYTLFGYDENNFRSTRKWLEVLTFNERNEPQFGGRYFVYPSDEIKAPQPAFRFLLEYKKDGAARIGYDPEMDMIVFDHLVSESKDPTKKYTLVPDGDHEGFKWKDGKWVYIEKVFNTKLRDGQFPMEAPLKDESGKSNEAKLLEQSQKNMKRAEAQKKKDNPPPKKKSGGNEEEY
jgi:hypothetical protein